MPLPAIVSLPLRRFIAAASSCRCHAFTYFRWICYDAFMLAATICRDSWRHTYDTQRGAAAARVRDFMSAYRAKDDARARGARAARWRSKRGSAKMMRSVTRRICRAMRVLRPRERGARYMLLPYVCRITIRRYIIAADCYACRHAALHATPLPLRFFAILPRYAAAMLNTF